MPPRAPELYSILLHVGTWLGGGGGGGEDVIRGCACRGGSLKRSSTSLMVGSGG